MRRIVRTVVGTIVLLAGVAMLVLPGPAVFVIPLGLTILAIDFPWARAVVQKLRIRFSRNKPSQPAAPKPQA
jgi:tellurite resistance protein TerC